MNAKTIMITGTMSSVGKSLLTAGLCRLFVRKGLRVLPFKAQNMSNNAAVCPGGGEIGRAQAVQAFAAGVAPTIDMNPILLKPETDHKSQVIVRGDIWGTYAGKDYYIKREELWHLVTESLDRLRSNADLVIIEGAGGIAELNLMNSDIVNLAVARYCGAPCLLVGDIDRGGVFAQLLGSWWLLNKADRKHIRGFIVNKFRGDPGLFADGLSILEKRSQGVPVVGLVPYLNDHGIADEDAASFSKAGTKNDLAVKIVVVQIPHISNFDDFDALKREENVCLEFSDSPEALRTAGAILIPGTKNTIEDLEWLKSSGMADKILEKFHSGTPVAGICGGYQILGKVILNPQHVESEIEECAGLGILPVKTRLTPQKVVTLTKMRVLPGKGFWNRINGEILSGYEIHTGRSESSGPLFLVTRSGSESWTDTDGCCVNDGISFGTYLHGIFNNDSFRGAWLKSIGIQPSNFQWNSVQEESMDHWADHLEKHIDMDKIQKIIETGV
ncbi:MAG: cobyric acid synthase [Flexilinea sp.]